MLQEQMDNSMYDWMTAFIKECGIKKYPCEACGLIYAGDDEKPVWVECKNVSDDPENNFLIAPSEYLEVESKGKIVGCWHTHCDIPPNASDADKQGCINTQVPWFIGSVYKEGVKFRFEGLKEVRPDNGYKAPLIGRPYSYGVFDCFSLARDYFKQVLGIDIPNIPRVEQIWKTEDDYMHRMAANVFDLVRLPDGTPPHIGDVFFIQTGTFGADHIAIYVGNDRILHQMRNKLSKEDTYGGSYWQEHTLSHWRHKSKC